MINSRGVKLQEHEGKKGKDDLHPIGRVDLPGTPIPPVSAFRDVDAFLQISMKQKTCRVLGR